MCRMDDWKLWCSYHKHIPDRTGTSKQEPGLFLSAFCMRAPRPSPVSVIPLSSGHFGPCSLDVGRSVEFLGQMTQSRYEWLPLQQSWRHFDKPSLPAGVHKMVMRTLLPAESEAHARCWQQIKIGCLFHCLEKPAQRKRQSSWQVVPSGLKKQGIWELSSFSAGTFRVLNGDISGFHISRRHC